MRQYIIVASIAGALVLGTGAAAFAHSAPLTDQTTAIGASHEQEQTAQPTPVPTVATQPTAEPATDPNATESAHATEAADPVETADPAETPEPTDQPEQKDTETESDD